VIDSHDVSIYRLPVVTLTQTQIRTALSLAKEGNDSYEDINCGVLFGDNGSFQSHLVGLLGELAVAELYGLDLDSTAYLWGDGGIDLHLGEKSSDVKTTATDMALPQLLVRADTPLEADIDIRCHIIDWSRTVRILGYAPKEVVENRPPRQHPGSRENYVVEPEELLCSAVHNGIRAPWFSLNSGRVAADPPSRHLSLISPEVFLY